MPCLDVFLKQGVFYSIRTLSIQRQTSFIWYHAIHKKPLKNILIFLKTQTIPIFHYRLQSLQLVQAQASVRSL